MAEGDAKAVLQRWTVAHHRVSIWGKAIDGVTRKPIPGVEITLVGVPAEFKKVLELSAGFDGQWGKKIERPDKTRSRGDGLFFFLDLPEGKYEVRAILPDCGRRYGETRESIKVLAGDKNQDGIKALTSMWVSLALPPTGIKGRVVDSATRAGVMMAEVRLKGSGERTFSNARGEFTLAPIEASERTKRTLQAFAQGYSPAKAPAVAVAATTGKITDLGDVGLVRR